MDNLNLDYNRLPTLITLILVTVSTFKKPIGALITSFVPEAVTKFFGIRNQRVARREEHERLIEEILLDSEVQAKITDQMRDTRREEALIAIIKDKDRWLEEVLDKKLDQIQEQQVKMVDELMAIHRNSERTNNILETIHVTLAKRRTG